MGKYSDDLASLDDKWAATKVDSGDKFPDGTHQASISRVSIGESKDHSRLFVVWELLGVSPEVEGMTHKHFRTLDDKNLPWLKKELAVCGVELERLSDLEDRLPELLDKVLEITVKTKAGDNQNFTNTYFNAKVADDTVPF